MAALVLLFVDHFDRVSDLAAALAFATLLVAGVRLWLTLGEHMTLLGTSRGEATTDALTGLRNRRALAQRPGTSYVRRRLAAAPAAAAALRPQRLQGLQRHLRPSGRRRAPHRLGRALARAVDGRGHAYRMGGDEFCVLTAAPEDQHAELAARDARGLSERGDGFEITRSARHRHDRRARQRSRGRAARCRPAHVRREERPPRIRRRPERGGAAARAHRASPRPRRPRRRRRRAQPRWSARELGMSEERPDGALAGRRAARHRQGRRTRRDPQQARAPRRG